jgi:hypothetical protein
VRGDHSQPAGRQPLTRTNQAARRGGRPRRASATGEEQLVVGARGLVVFDL